MIVALSLNVLMKTLVAIFKRSQNGVVVADRSIIEIMAGATNAKPVGVNRDILTISINLKKIT